MDKRAKIILGSGIAVIGLYSLLKKEAPYEPKPSKLPKLASKNSKLASKNSKLASKNSLVTLNPAWDKINSGYANKVPKEYAITKQQDISVTSDFRVIAVDGTNFNVRSDGKIFIHLVMDITNLSNKTHRIWMFSLNSTKYFGGSGRSFSVKENDTPLTPGETKTFTADASFALGTKTKVHLDFVKTLAVKIITF